MKTKPIAVTDRIRHEARVSGLRGFQTPSLEAVERRRMELWGLALLVLVAVSVGLVALSVWPGLEHSPLSPLGVRAALVAMIVLFGAYVVEKELHLRRLHRLLLDERVLTAALSNRLHEVSSLVSVGKAINSMLALEDVLEVILRSALELLQGSEGSIMLIDGQWLVTAAAVGNPRARGAKLSVGDGIAGHVAATREPLLISGPADAEQFVNYSPPERPPHSAMCVPLENRGDLLGVLNLNASERRAYTEHDLRALTVFAEHAAISIANARLYERERSRVDELLELGQMKSEFMAAVSHELRTPLTSILGGAATLRKGDLPPDRREALVEVIERQGHRLLRLIEQLLTAARLERQTNLSFDGKVDLAELVRRVAEEFAMSGRPIELEVPERCLVRGDEDSLEQVFVNLIDNAYKHGRPPVCVRIAAEGERVLASVEDSGDGVPPHERGRVFERFTRLTKREGGIGLGLSIVQRLLEASGGTISVEESVSGGAAFRLTLPAATVATPA
jgi:two-component system, OmpR family, sensor histidine kinase KdpD